MKKLYILILMSTLIACTDKNQNKSEIEQNSTHAKVQEPKIANQSGSKDDKLVQEKVNNNEPRISCSNQNITEWYGFDEAQEDPKCQIMDKFHLNSYKCEVSKNAFGADKDAILLEYKDQRIFTYPTANDCNEALEIRNSNAP